VGSKPFAPDFIDSLTATMRFSESLTERIYAWVRWRAWGNSAQFAATDWAKDRQRPLDQIDCIVDLRWFEEGKPLEWITGAPESVRTPARENTETRRAQYSRGFGRLEDEGRIEFKGRKIYPVVSPTPQKSAASRAEISNFRTDSEFLAHWKDTEFSNFLAREHAKQQLAEAQKLLREHDRIAEAAHRKYRQSATSDEPILMSVKTVVITATAEAPSPDPEPAAAAVPPPSGPQIQTAHRRPPDSWEPTTDEVAEVRTALAPFGPADFETAERLIVRCRQKCPDATAPEVAQMISEKSPSITRNTQNPIALLMKIVPPAFEGYRETMDWEQAAKRKVADLEKRLLDPDCLTVVEAEVEYGIPETVLFELIESTQLPFIDVGPRPGGKYRIMRRDLEALKRE